jgi:hypothetical protein
MKTGLLMKSSMIFALAAATFCMSANAATAEPSAAPKQQTKMALCNKDAVGKKGDERKAFMKQCLSGKGASMTAVEPAAAATAASRISVCKADAKGMRGNARKDFIKECEAKAG